MNQGKEAITNSDYDCEEFCLMIGFYGAIFVLFILCPFLFGMGWVPPDYKPPLNPEWGRWVLPLTLVWMIFWITTAEYHLKKGQQRPN